MVMKCSVNWYTRTRYLTLLAILLVPLYISLELCFFISDQYVFYRCAVDEGLTYEIMDGKFTLIANNQSDKRALEDGQRRAAWIGACNHSVRLLLGLLTTMIIGYISDHYGRRLSLIIMVIGEALQILTLSVVVLMQANPWLTVIPGLFDGAIGGGLLSIQAQVSASLTDIVSNEMFGKDVTNNKVSDENDLWALFTWFDGLALICLSLSYPLGGTILYRNGFLTPIIVCNVLIAMSLLLIFFLPESNTRIWSSSICKYNDEYIEIFLARNANSAIWKINCHYIKTNFKVLRARYKHHLLIGFIILFLSIVTSTDLYIIYIYLMGHPFLWNSQDVGIYSGVTDVISAAFAIALAIIMARNVQRPTWKSSNSLKLSTFDLNENEIQCKKKELHLVNLLLKTLFFSICMMFINRMILGISHLFTPFAANILVYIAAIPRFAKGLNNPILRTLISLWTDKINQGMMHSFVAFISRLGVLICFSALIFIYSSTINLLPGTVFFVCCSLILTAMIATGFLCRFGNINGRFSSINYSSTL
uniref:Uncharacterized protein n=1 Tax=Schistosoma japonicum TaxID=6182 RepID=C1LD64_SCHJA|nr:hypothetical protein [Schistosoma japonicum]